MTVDETGVDEMTVDETGVDEMVVDETGVDKLGLNPLHKYFINFSHHMMTTHQPVNGGFFK